MQTEVNQYYTKWHRLTEKMNRNAESLDTPVDERVDAEELTIGSLLVSNDDVESQALTTVYYQGEFNKLSNKQKKIIYICYLMILNINTYPKNLERVFNG